MRVMDRVELTGITAVVGTAHEVRNKLNLAKNQQVVAFLLPHSSVEQRAAITQTMETLIEITIGRSISRKREVLESLVNAFCPALAEPKSVRREAEMVAKARADVIESAEWLSAAQVAGLASLSTVNPNSQPSRWKREGRIFAIKPTGSVELFPAYGLDPSSGYRPLRELAEIIKILGEKKDAWGMAYWFASLNGFLGGTRPQDVLTKEPRRVIAAAAQEIEDIVHG